MTFEEYVNSSAFETEVRDTGEKRKRSIMILRIIGAFLLVLSLSLLTRLQKYKNKYNIA